MRDILARRTAVHVAGTILLLAATLTASRVTSDRRAEPLVAPLSSIPLQIGSFTGEENPSLAVGVLNELKATDYLSRSYQQPDMDADLFIAFYARQRPGESMHSPKHCLPGAGWEIWDYSTLKLLVGGQYVPVNKYSVSRVGDRKVVLYWYQSKDRVFASEYLGKLLLGRDSLLKNTTAAAIVRITVPDKPGAVEAASGFAIQVIPQVHRLFPQ